MVAIEGSGPAHSSLPLSPGLGVSNTPSLLSFLSAEKNTCIFHPFPVFSFPLSHSHILSPRSLFSFSLLLSFSFILSFSILSYALHSFSILSICLVLCLCVSTSPFLLPLFSCLRSCPSSHPSGPGSSSFLPRCQDSCEELGADGECVPGGCE